MGQYTHKTELKQNSKGHLLEVTFSGSLTLQSAKEIKETFESFVDNYATITITANDVSGIDVSFIQIIEAYKREMIAKGKKVNIVMDLPLDLKTLLANSGISYPVRISKK